MDYLKLFIDNCPIVYFNKQETYMPIDFEDILTVAKINPINLHKVNVVYLYEDDEQYTTIGKQILCKTTGEIEIDGNKYIDLIYIITYLWSNNHPFDKSTIIVRLDENKKLIKICCVNKKKSIWYDNDELEFENNRPILISSLRTHDLYNKKHSIKDIKWNPSEFVIYNNKTVKLFDINGNYIEKNMNHYLYDKNIGNEIVNQQMPASIKFNTFKMDAFYNYNGDVFNLFNDYNNGISFNLIFKILLLLFIVIMIFYDMIKYKPNLFNIAYLICIILLFLINSLT